MTRFEQSLDVAYWAAASDIPGPAIVSFAVHRYRSCGVAAAPAGLGLRSLWVAIAAACAADKRRPDSVTIVIEAA